MGCYTSGANHRCITGCIRESVLTYLHLPAMKNGNYLSPYTAYMAEMVGDRTMEGLKRCEGFYLKQVATIKEWISGKDHHSAWGHTWPCSMLENNIDVSFGPGAAIVFLRRLLLAQSWSLPGSSIFI